MRPLAILKAMGFAVVILAPIVTAKWLDPGMADAAEKKTEDKVDVNLDRESAIKIAEIVLVRVYGKAVLEERPWKVTLKNGVFRIEGTLHYEKGSVATIEIDQANARVVRIVHYK
jgi:hypothetical protein